MINVSDEDEDVQCTSTRSPPPLPPSSPPLDPLTICSDISTTTTTTINTTTGVKPFKFGQLSLPQQKTWMNSRLVSFIVLWAMQCLGNQEILLLNSDTLNVCTCVSL